MFNMFPFNLGNGFSFSSFTSFTTSNGTNFFSNINGYCGMNDSNNNYYNNYNNGLENSFYNGFYNGLNSGFNNALNSIDTEALEGELKNLMKKISDNINFNQLPNDYNNIEKEEECTFIKFEEFQDMYVLRIDLTGINLRELSIKYNPGIIEINLKRSEIKEYIDYNGYESKKIVKKTYKKVFNDIDDIELSHVLKSIDGGNFNMKMPKKYVIDKGSNIVEVDKYIVEDEKKEIKEKV